MLDKKNQLNNRVIVALSGGVDSSVAAYLLKKQGFDVSAVYLQIWSKEDDITDCPWHDDIASAAAACEHLGIPFQSLHVEKEYQEKVVKYLIDGYQRGLTPNPDIMCNREIKFGVFLDWAEKQKADYIATGHYVRKLKIKNEKLKITIKNSKLTNNKLLKGVDQNKDQSYFLYTLTQQQLSKILFPSGEYTKPDVRKIAREAGLPNWDRKDSQGICFIGKVQLPRFLQEYIKPQPGDVITTDGQKIGQHNGVFYYTIGQRHGLDLGSVTDTSAYYIVEKRLTDNVIVVGRGKNHPALYRNELVCDHVNWISGEEPTMPLTCGAKIRYRQEDAECVVRESGVGSRETGRSPSESLQKKYIVKFINPQFAVAPGQSVVFYQGEECLGGGIIN